MVYATAEVLVVHPHPISGNDMILTATGVAEIVNRHARGGFVRDVAVAHDDVVNHSDVVASNQVDPDMAWINEQIRLKDDESGRAACIGSIAKNDSGS